MYEKYFLDIVKTINEQVQKKWTILTGRNNDLCLFGWAQINVPALYAQERALDIEMNALWDDTHKTFETFKTKVLAWGRVVLQIYKKFAEIVS